MRTVRIGGVDVELVTAAEAEAADVVVCGETSYFADDVRTVCSSCRATVFHRPHVPARPPRLCLACFLAMVGPKQ
jgi:hypothetical protein